MYKTQILKILLAFFMLFPMPAFSETYNISNEENININVYEKINPAIVCVDSQISNGLSCGTGCIIDKSGIILTSAHVVDEGNSIVVTMSNGQNYTAKVIKKMGEHKEDEAYKVIGTSVIYSIILGIVMALLL